jgi:methionine-rich copper-binding protein CopC
LVLGYASSPGSPAEKDGVVISTNVFGLGSGRFGMGRTATHEVGHWLGLKHIWGDGYCGDDGVDDTPKQQAANRGCITGVKLSCGNTTTGDMYMNFMDMVDDPCMVMFSAGQVSRMRSQFLSAGARNSLLTSNGLTAAPVVAPNPVQNPVVTTAATPARVEAYPSPATSQLFVRFSEEINIAGKHVSIYNQMGQRVTTIIAANNNVQVNVQGWAKGMYVARLEEDVTLMVRFMKM